MTEHDHGAGHGPEFFDASAATWDDDPTKVARSHTIAAAIADAVPLSASTRLLEYGAGTAVLSQALADRVGTLTLVDTSAGMRAVMEEKVAAGALPASTRVRDELPDEPVDVIAASMVLHHVHDLDPVLRSFAGLLEAGGHLCVADLEAEDGSFHGEGFEGHAGFDPDELVARLRSAGFGDVEVRRDVLRVERNGAEYPLFLAIARR